MSRFHRHNTFSVKGEKPITYWMQQTHRFQDNYALMYAIEKANEHHLPLNVLFVLNKDYPYANTRNMTFMLEGLKTLKQKYLKAGIGFILEVGDFKSKVINQFKDASMLIMDQSYMRGLRDIKTEIGFKATKQNLACITVENDVIVPVQEASDKAEYAARTIRKKLLGKLDAYHELPKIPTLNNKIHRDEAIILDQPIKTILNKIGLNDSIQKSDYYVGGEAEAFKVMASFVKENLNNYKDANDPSKNLTSKLSMYLHFGMISPLRIYNTIEENALDNVSKKNFLEQLFIRRELAFNYVIFHEGYDQFETMTEEWAYKTMDLHVNDPRKYLYTIKDYLAFNTHDEAFNACMKEMVKTGYMHNYMRMYWGKKIIEWSPDYKTAYETIIYLNNTYFIDGRDPVSYASVAWLFGKHDQGWKEREIFGKLRYMNFQGLKRKFDIKTYIAQCEKL